MVSQDEFFATREFGSGQWGWNDETRNMGNHVP